MRRILSLVVFAGILALAVGVQAAAKTAPAATAGAEVKTAFFDLTIPEGWMMPQKVRKLPNNAVAAIFATTDKKVAVAMTGMNAPMDAKTVAEQTVANMRKGDLEADEPVRKGDFYVVTMRPKSKSNPDAKGMAVFGSDGKVCTVTTITGTDMAAADKLLQAIKPLKGAKFPTTVE